MSLLGSLLGVIFGTKKPKKKHRSGKKSAKPKSKPSPSARTKPVQILDAHPTVRYTIPAPLSPDQHMAQSRAAWHPPGRPVRIAGRLVPSGMIYTGPALESISGYRTVDPALIDPTLTVAPRHPDTAGNHLSYWPSYSDLHPESRAAYLDWLAADRPAGAPIGYVFLFFYGIERRVLFDARHDRHARAEIPLLVEEVERLRRLYPDKRSFHAYATDFLVAAHLMQGLVDPRQLEPPLVDDSWELPLATKVALGVLAASHQPVPPIWALSWATCDPAARLRTPARRCTHEFAALFRLAYRQQFGDGMRLDVSGATFDPTYRPASAGFRAPVRLGSEHLPDVTAQSEPLSRLRSIVEHSTMLLDDYSRAIGPTTTPTPSALAYLPVELGDISHFSVLEPLTSYLAQILRGTNAGIVDTARLLQCFPEISERATPKQRIAISRLVQRLGYGLEPDPATHRKLAASSPYLGLYRRPAGMPDVERNLDGAIGMLSIGATLAHVDGVITSDEARLLLDQVNRAYALTEVESWRVQAHLHWLTTQPPTLAAARKRLAQLTPEQIAQTMHLLLTITTLDGAPAPEKVEYLSRLYRTLGLDEQRLHSDLHERTTGAGRIPAPNPRSPEAHGAAPAPRPAIALDPAFLQLVQQQTDEISDLLDQVFTDAIEPDVPSPDTEIDSPATDNTPGDLDPYSRLIVFLSRQPSWELPELSRMAASLGLMTSGAIEMINDRAIEMGLDPLLDCDERCDVDESTLAAMLDELGITC